MKKQNCYYLITMTETTNSINGRVYRHCEYYERKSGCFINDAASCYKKGTTNFTDLAICATKEEAIEMCSKYEGWIR